MNVLKYIIGPGYTHTTPHSSFSLEKIDLAVCAFMCYCFWFYLFLCCVVLFVLLTDKDTNKLCESKQTSVEEGLGPVLVLEGSGVVW